MMRKLILIFIVISLVGCNASKKFGEADFHGQYITYQVKLKLETKSFKNVTLNGYFCLNRDSFLCFKFYGRPFGYEIVSGYFRNELLVFDHYNNILHSDALQQLISTTGIVFDRKIFEDMLTGELPGLKTRLENLNGTVLDIKMANQRMQSLEIANKPRNARLNLLVNYRGQFPGKIELNYADLMDKWKVVIDILRVTNEQRKCNFSYIPTDSK